MLQIDFCARKAGDRYRFRLEQAFHVGRIPPLCRRCEPFQGISDIGFQGARS